MIFTFTLNGVKQQRDIPTGWDQVKFKHFIELESANETKALSLFTGFDEPTIRKTNVSKEYFQINPLKFLQTDVPLMKFPKKIQGFDVPYDLGFEQWGQYMDLKDELDKGLKGIELIKQFPLICAIYTMKDYDFKEAEKRALEFMDAPCTEVMAVGNFTLMKLIALRSNTQNNSLPEGTPLRKFRLALKVWWTNMVFTVRFFILKRKLHLTEKN